MSEQTLEQETTQPQPTTETQSVEAAEYSFDFGKLTVPDGLTVDDDVKASLTEFANKYKVAVEDMQGILDRGNALAASVEAAMQKRWEETTAQWKEEALKAYNGSTDALSAAVNRAAKVIDRYGSDELKSALNESGLGSHPAVVSFFDKLSSVVLEPQPVNGQAQTPPPNPLATIYSKSPELFGGRK